MGRKRERGAGSRSSCGGATSWLAWAGLVLAVLALAAPALATERRSTDTTVRVLSTSGRDAVWNAWKANFERANPGISIKLEFLAVQSYAPALLTQLQGGNGPDIMFMQGGSGQIHSVLNLAQGGRLSDLSSQPWTKRVPAPAKPLFKIGNKVYGLPLALVPTGLVYNTDLFAQNGLKPPTTFAQLLTLCSKVKTLGKSPIVFAGATFDAGNLGQMIAASTVYAQNPNWNADRRANKTTFASTPGWRQALQRIVDMKNADCFAPSVSGLSLTGVFGTLGSGQALMWPGPSVAFAPIRAVAPNLNLASTPFPSATVKGTQAMAGYTDSLGVNAASPNKAAAIKFLTFIAREGQSRIYTKFNSAISLHDANVANIPPVVKGFTPFLKTNKYALYPNSSWPNPDVYAALGSGITGLMTGQTSVDSILTALDAAWNKG